MWDTNSKSFQLGIRINGHSLWDKSRNAVFNATNGKLTLKTVAIGGNDTDMVYDVQLERKDGRKPTNEQVFFVKSFLLGIAAGRDENTRLTGNGLPGA
jgi:hypothetical protein